MKALHVAPCGFTGPVVVSALSCVCEPLSGRKRAPAPLRAAAGKARRRSESDDGSPAGWLALAGKC